jgi:Transcription factor e(y)2
MNVRSDTDTTHVPSIQSHLSTSLSQTSFFADLEDLCFKLLSTSNSSSTNGTSSQSSGSTLNGKGVGAGGQQPAVTYQELYNAVIKQARSTVPDTVKKEGVEFIAKVLEGIVEVVDPEDEGVGREAKKAKR